MLKNVCWNGSHWQEFWELDQYPGLCLLLNYQGKGRIWKEGQENGVGVEEVHGKRVIRSFKGWWTVSSFINFQGEFLFGTMNEVESCQVGSCRDEEDLGVELFTQSRQITLRMNGPETFAAIKAMAALDLDMMDQMKNEQSEPGPFARGLIQGGQNCHVLVTGMIHSTQGSIDHWITEEDYQKKALLGKSIGIIQVVSEVELIRKYDIQEDQE